MGRCHPLAFVLAGLAALFLATLHARVAVYREWQRAPERFFAGDVPVAGTDSYLYFRYAREHRQEIGHGGRDRLRRFPEGREYPARSVLAECIAAVSDWTGLELHRAGIWITMVGAGLFVFPLGLYFYRLGSPLAGLWGAFVGSFGTSYRLRTAPHRVDTDGGNLFLLWCISLLVLEAGLRRDLRGALAAAAGAGLCLNGFCLWYQQPAFAAPFGVAFLLYLAARRVGARRILLLGAVFALCADPRSWLRAGPDLHAFALRYLVAGGADPAGVLGGLRFPSVLSEIAELRRLPPLDALALAAGQRWLGLVGLAGFAWVACRQPVAMLPLLPLLGLAVLGLARAQRFLMYLGPFLGVGCGALLRLGLDAASRAGSGAERPGPTWRDVSLGLAGVAPLALLFAVLPAVSPAPGISVELIRSLQRMRPLLPQRSVIAHTWAHGYLVTAVTGAATFNDGQEPDPVVEQLLDRGLTDPDPRVLHDLLSFLAVRGRAGVEAAAGGHPSYPELLERIRAAARPAGPPPPPPLYLLLSEKMLRSFGNSWWKGRWDFEAGTGSREGYDLRRCRSDAAELVCNKPGQRDLRFDPARGLLDGEAAVAHFVRVASGVVVDERSYAHGGRLWLQLVDAPDPEPEWLHVLKGPVFASNFNQMFVLGRYDASLFRPVVDDPPTARLYAVLPAQPGAR